VGWTVQGSNLGRAKNFFSPPKGENRRWDSPTLFFKGYRSLSRGYGGREAKLTTHSHPPSAEVKNKWSYNSTTSMHLPGVESENFAFTFYNI
jgi:hypothetical protein